MDAAKQYIRILKKEYSERIREIDRMELSDSILQMALQWNTPKEVLIPQYRDYLEASLFGESFRNAFMGIKTRSQLKELYKGSPLVGELDALFADWDQAVSSEQIWNLIKRRKKK